ncbi:hypothetical protein B0A55_08731 [Friedmanniomyces simplex]|uniref:Mtf2-like C-terminal domain-containing protein n=1 Tax=Friedmanniomyces simplex TaxID=329884 RepID=A0A4U0WLC5_9PEZI|nr:hypothetical protein B0A55_08731 [Friedmanniomyces simplex]
MLEKAACRLQACRHHNLLRAGALLPFLYCTNTIQQRTYAQVGPRVRTFLIGDDQRPEHVGWRPQTASPEQPERQAFRRPGRQPFPSRDQRRTGQRRGDGVTRPHRDTTQHATTLNKTPPLSEGVPFEDRAQELIAGRDPDSSSTVTPREKKVFEKLLGLSRDDKATRAPSRDGKSRYNDSDREIGLDAILDTAVADIQSRERPPPQFPASLRPLAEEARDKQRASRLARSTEIETVGSKATLVDLNRTNALLDDAPTDHDLWHILHTRILARLAALELDGPPTTPRQQATVREWTQKHAEPSTGRVNRARKKSKPSEFELLTSNLPHNLLHYMSLNSTSFPTSLLPLKLLPALHSLGPTAFALGATTQLYNAHLALLHRHYPANLPAINSTLAEMDRQVYAFDDETLGIVDGILRVVGKFRHGHAGPGPQALFQMEGVGREVAGLGRWSRVMRERREQAALRRVREEEGERERVAEERERGGMEEEEAEEDEEGEDEEQEGEEEEDEEQEVDEEEEERVVVGGRG